MTTSRLALNQSSLLDLAARTALAALFLVSGVAKLLSFGAVAGWIGHVGLPLPKLVLVGTIGLELIGGVLLVAGWRVRAVAYAFAAFTLLAGVLFHPFWSAEAGSFDNELTHFLKNIALVGGLLALAELERSRRTSVRTSPRLIAQPSSLIGSGKP